VTSAFAIAAIAVSLIWLAIIAIAAVRGLRWLAERGTRHHDMGRQIQEGGDGSVNIQAGRDITSHPECLCYEIDGGSTYGRSWTPCAACITYYREHDRWPAWSQGFVNDLPERRAALR
jgi:hypothetical protein